MPPPLSQSEVFSNAELARFMAVMVMNNPEFEQPCQSLRVMFWCMDGDRLHQFVLSDIKNRLDTLLYQRPDYYEPVKVFRGYVGLRDAFEDYGQRRPKLLRSDW